MKRNPTLGDMVYRLYSREVRKSNPEEIAKWVIAIRQISANYPELWKTPLAEIGKSNELPPQGEDFVLLFPALAASVASLSDALFEIAENEEDEIKASSITCEMMAQLFRIVYLAGHLYGQREPKDNALF